jgi:hypothetical protein
MTSALALGHAGLRLRSRRIRSGRSHRLSPAFAVAAAIATIAASSGIGYLALLAGGAHPGVGGGVGFGGSSSTRPESPPVVDAATLEHQHLVANVRPIDAQIQRTIAQEGLLIATYQSGQIDRAELQRQLADVLSGYRAATAQVSSLDLPPSLQTNMQAEEQALTALTQSAIDLSQAFDDGDQARVTAALGRSLEATARLHALSDDLSAR